MIKIMINTTTRKKLLIGFLAIDVLLLIPVLLIVASYLIINPYKNRVVSIDEAPKRSVGLVLGAGITAEGKPYKELEARLDSGAEALAAGKVDKLILSGDNRFFEYNEPQAMKDYLIAKGIASEKLIPDYAGRSTFESCERANKIFGQSELIIFSAGSHLPRAIFLCKHFGIDSYGVANNVEAIGSTRREILARVKALYNVYIKGEPTVLGDPINP